MKLKEAYTYRDDIQSQGLKDLCNYIKSVKPKIYNLCDVGVYAGESTIIFYNEFKQTIAIVAIDNWDVSNFKNTNRTELETEVNNAEFNFNEQIRGLKRITKIKGNVESQNVLLKIPNNYFDVIYVDTVNIPEKYQIHLKNMLNKLKPGGFIAGSNFNISKKFNEAIYSVIGNPDKIFKDNSWIKKI
jgi:predicted O-methyltransferase YrrM